MQNIWNIFKNYGLWGILKKFKETIKNIFIKIFYGTIGLQKLEEKKKKLAQANESPSLEEIRIQILNDWKAEWNKEKGIPYEEDFCKLFEAIYYFASSHIQSNKINNFLWKRRFIYCLVVGVILYITFFIWNIFRSASGFVAVAENGLLFIILFLLTGIVSNWIDAKMYQQTWVRHSSYFYQMQKEMNLYIYGIVPYDIATTRRRLFIQNVMQIFDNNQKKFEYNMSKEKNMMDIFEQFSKVKNN